MQGKNRRGSGVYELYMSIPSLFLTPQDRRAAGHKQLLAFAANRIEILHHPHQPLYLHHQG